MRKARWVIVLVAIILAGCPPKQLPNGEQIILKYKWNAFGVGMIWGDDINAPEPLTRKLWLRLEKEGLKPIVITLPNSENPIGTNQPALVEPYVWIGSAIPGNPGCIRSVISSRGINPSLRNVEVHTRLEGFSTPGDRDRCIEEHVVNIKKALKDNGY
jgi:hypothetical protein